MDISLTKWKDVYTDEEVKVIDNFLKKTEYATTEGIDDVLDYEDDCVKKMTDAFNGMKETFPKELCDKKFLIPKDFDFSAEAEEDEKFSERVQEVYYEDGYKMVVDSVPYGDTYVGLDSYDDDILHDIAEDCIQGGDERAYNYYVEAYQDMFVEYVNEKVDEYISAIDKTRIYVDEKESLGNVFTEYAQQAFHEEKAVEKPVVVNLTPDEKPVVKDKTQSIGRKSA